ncbi:MAG: DinB family protein [Bryobacteraceae bacterium]
MNRLIICSIALSATALLAPAAEPAKTPVNKIFDQQLRSVEREVVSLAEAMPADKYSFAPTKGDFAGVRTFAQQMTHIAFVIYSVSSATLQEPNPTQPGTSENGPSSIQGKEQVVKYLKDAFVYAHKAMNSLTEQNLTDPVKSAFGNGDAPRISMATVAVWHTFDHYGQAVVYARMNGITPPASRR